MTADDTPPTATPDPAAAPESPGPPGPDDRLVPVIEAIRYRKRAQQAEGQLAAQAQQLDDLRRRLDEAQGRLVTLEQRSRLDAALAEADTADPDAARTLAEAVLASMETPDPAKAVGELKRRKPYLFHTRTPAASVMGPRVDDFPGVPGGRGALPTVEHAAQQARASGDRRDLLAYLRLRRTK